MPSATETSIRSHARTENFPVALRILTRDQRRHLLSIYDFARLTDQIGDAGDGDRLARLDALESELERAVEVVEVVEAVEVAKGEPSSSIIAELVTTIRDCEIPLELFRRLIAANRRDQHQKRYANWNALLDYCALSANPIGELVLRVFGVAVAPRLGLSDRVCSGLQIVEHLQDIREDYAADRIYLPADDLEKFGCQPWQLGARFASPAVRRLVRFEAERARALLEAGDPLAASLNGRARIAVSGFVAGGRAALDAIERAHFDTLAVPTPPRRKDVVRHILALQRSARRARRAA